MMFKVALYVRATAEDSKKQIKEMTKLCTDKGWVVHHTYVDIITPDNVDPYKYWKQIMSDSELEQYDLLVFWTYHDFGRKDRNMFKALLKLRKHHINWHSFLEEEFSTVNLNSVTMNKYLDIFASIDKHHKGISSKVGQILAKEKGIHIGRSKLPQEIYDKIFQLRDLGYSYSQIKKAVTYTKSNGEIVNVSVGTIANVLKKYEDCSKSDVGKKPIISHENLTNHSKSVVENLGDGN